MAVSPLLENLGLSPGPWMNMKGEHVALGVISTTDPEKTAKINQGNTALKRVVESIANGDSHVLFRDSKLTMLLQDSFEDDKSKILMILCASPDPTEMHRTISTLEYGAKAKCIVRAAHMPTPCKTNSEESSVILSSRIVAMNQFIFKLQMENKIKEKERDEAQKELIRKEEEVNELRAKLKLMEGSAIKEEEIKSKVDERTLILRLELDKMEKKMLQQQEELETLRQRLVEMECEKGKFGDNEKMGEDALQDIGTRFMSRLSALCADNDTGMEKSMELDVGDPVIHDVKEVRADTCHLPNLVMAEDDDPIMSRFPEKVLLSTVFEGEEGEEIEREQEEEVEKEVIEENYDKYSSTRNLNFCPKDNMEERQEPVSNFDDSTDPESTRRTRIQNIFRLCGNHRELAQQVKIPTPSKGKPEAANPSASPLPRGDESGMTPLQSQYLKAFSQPEVTPQNGFLSKNRVTKSPLSGLLAPFSAVHLTDEQKSVETQSSSLTRHTSSDKENNRPGREETAGHQLDICLKWEAPKDIAENLKKLKVVENKLPFSPLENKLLVAAVNSPSKISPNISQNLSHVTVFQV